MALSCWRQFSIKTSASRSSPTCSGVYSFLASLLINSVPIIAVGQGRLDVKRFS
jgi:hypothetical protein